MVLVFQKSMRQLGYVGFTKEVMILEIIKSCLNIPYIWGGKNPLTGFDCSGLVEWGLQSVGFDPPGLNSAAMIYHWLILGNGVAVVHEPKGGDICFYGKNIDHITHIAIMIDSKFLIEAGGGDSFTKTVNDAKIRGACVRVRPLGHRKDLVAVISPNYPKHVLEA